MSHAVTEGWSGRRNGELLRLMLTAGFGSLVTVDRNLHFQQNIATSGVVVVVLHARSNRVADLLPLMPALRDALRVSRAGHVVHLGA